MHILVIDGGHVEAEFRAKFGPGHEYNFLTLDPPETAAAWEQLEQLGSELLSAADVLFSFSEGLWPLFLEKKGQAPYFAEASTNVITQLGKGFASIFGFCGLPTLLNRPLLEVSLYHEANRAKLAETCAALGTDYRVVEDRVGLVTPRVICMIVNEACYTLQEGTASIQDIDLAMKLGTGYPRGPFEWANAIGVARVHAVLEAMWHDTHDEQYKICPLLKRQALRGEPFTLNH